MKFESLVSLEVELLYCRETASFYVADTGYTGGTLVRVGTKEKNNEQQMFEFFDEIVVEEIEKAIDKLRDWND